MKNNISYKIGKFSLILLALLSSNQLSAKTMDLLSSISSDMKHFNNIATTTKQNEQYQPYIVSVFQGKELEKLGVLNLKEALELVPGVDMATDNFNNKTPIFRGSNPLAYGQTKLFIDEVLVNNVFFDSYSEYLYLPTEMIKRIEVVRGPGSKMDGVNAYAGSINVITYAEDFKGFESTDKLVFKYGSFDYKMGGFTKTYKAEDFKLFLDFYYQQDHKEISSGKDALSQGIFGANNIPLSQSGDIPLWIENYSLGINLEYKDFFLKAKLLDHKKGSAYGINLAIPQNDNRVKLPSYILEAGYNKKIDDYKIDIKAGIKYDKFDSMAKLAPDDLTLGSTVFEDGIYGEHLAEQRTYYQSSYIKYNGIDKHSFTIGYKYTKEETIDMTSKLSNRLTGEVGLVDYTDTLPFFDADAERNTLVVSFEDEFQLSNKIDFIYGFNYENNSYNNIGFEPRVSMVYQLDTSNIFKTIYSRSHRNPSWQEMFTENNSARVGNTELEQETVDAFEFAYIKKFSNDTYLQTNLFYLLNKDQIYNTPLDPAYRNAVDTDIYGLELEYKGHISSVDKIYLNYSYVDGDSNIKDEDRTQGLANVANHMLKAYYIYNINDNLSLSSIAKHVGSKDRNYGDERDKVDSYTTLDAALRYNNIKYNYTLTFSAKNIFDTDVAYPSPSNSYEDDYSQEGRTLFISFTKEF